MCGSIPPAPLTATLPTSTAGATGGGAKATPATPAKTTPATASATTTAGGPDAKGGGTAPEKLPVQGGGASDGAATLNSAQLQQTLTSLVQALTALTELLKSMPSSVAGASGGGPTQAPTQTPTQTPTQGGGDKSPVQGGGAPGKCDTPPPTLTGGGGTATKTTPAKTSASTPHTH